MRKEDMVSGLCTRRGEEQEMCMADILDGSKALEMKNFTGKFPLCLLKLDKKVYQFITYLQEVIHKVHLSSIMHQKPQNHMDGELLSNINFFVCQLYATWTKT